MALTTRQKEALNLFSQNQPELTPGTQNGANEGILTGQDSAIRLGEIVNDLENSTFNVLQFGADPTGVSDSTTAFEAALEAAGSVGTGTQSPAHNIYVPKGTYLLSNAFRVVRGVRLHGDGPYASVLRFAPGVGGIIVESYESGPDSEGNGAYSTIEHLGVEPTDNVNTWQATHAYVAGDVVVSTVNAHDGLVFVCTVGGTSGGAQPTMPAHGSTVVDGTVTWRADWCAGIWLKATSYVRDVAIGGVTGNIGFDGHGFQVYASVALTPPTNANGWRAEQIISVNNRGSGIYTNGGDANRGLVTSSLVSGNDGWGVYDTGFLGNTYQSIISQSNGLGGYTATNANARSMFYDCYSEGDEDESHIIYPSMVVGGLYYTGFTAGSTGSRLYQGQLIKTPIVGTTTNDAAIAGNVGECISSIITRTFAISLTSNTPANITSITLTPGDWDISAVACRSGSGGGNAMSMGISTVSATMPSSDNIGNTRFDTPTVSTLNSDACVSLPPVRVSLAANTVYYLVINTNFTGPAGGWGRISARRVR
jgi:hypothetical protein